MLSLGPATKVYLAAGATDLRAGFERLSVLVQAVLEQNALSGHLFVFCNAARTRIRILYWHGTGFWILTKRPLPGGFHTLHRKTAQLMDPQKGGPRRI